jgi:hypothetical protein
LPDPARQAPLDQAPRHPDSLKSPFRARFPGRLSPKSTMPLFWKPYKSEVSSFIDELKAKKPTLEAEQLAGRALLWDKKIDRELQSEYQEAAVAQQPYVYQTHVK